MSLVFTEDRPWKMFFVSWEPGSRWRRCLFSQTWLQIMLQRSQLIWTLLLLKEFISQASIRLILPSLNNCHNVVVYDHETMISTMVMISTMFSTMVMISTMISTMVMISTMRPWSVPWSVPAVHASARELLSGEGGWWEGGGVTQTLTTGAEWWDSTTAHPWCCSRLRLTTGQCDRGWRCAASSSLHSSTYWGEVALADVVIDRWNLGENNNKKTGNELKLTSVALCRQMIMMYLGG